MSEKPAVVVPFESGANQRSIGTVNGRDLTSMKKQLSDLEIAISQCAKDIVARGTAPVPVETASQGPATLVAPTYAKLYPAIEPEPVKALPAVPIQHPEGIVEDIDSVIKTIMSVVKQMTELFSANASTHSVASAGAPAQPAPTSSTPSSAPSSAPASPMYSRTLPGMECATLTKVAPSVAQVKVKEIARAVKDQTATNKLKDTNLVRVEVEPPSSDQIKESHDLLDTSVKKGITAKPGELIIRSEDELYCIRKFRKMISDEQERVAQNFHKRLDKLCNKN